MPSYRFLLRASAPSPAFATVLFSLILLILPGSVPGSAYAETVRQPDRQNTDSTDTTDTTDTIAQRVIACAACHGKEGRATRDGYFPRIAGKPAGYLYNQLLNFRDTHRHSPAMSYMVRHLSDAYLKEMAEYFASLELPYPPAEPTGVSAPVLDHGRTLAMKGDPSRQLPACIACHGDTLSGMLPAVPGLLGLSRDYLNAQFGAWRLGKRRAAAPDCMADISRRLTPEDISAVSAWLSSQPVPQKMKAQSPDSRKPPVRCGSMPQ